jgi:hypothetical protein
MAIAIRFSLHNAQQGHYNALTHLLVGLGWHPAPPNTHYQFPHAKAPTPLDMLGHGQIAVQTFNNYMAGIAVEGVSVASFSMVFDEALPYNAIW